jgi:hypothetical protein
LWQVPPLQTSSPLQTLPHMPQLLRSDWLFVQTPPQTSKPAGHLHSPLTQFSPPEQAWPHEPQFDVSARTLTHAPAHAVVLAPQSALHVPFLQTWFAAQACPQVPQFLGSRLSCTHAPLQSVTAPPPPPSDGQPHEPLLQT